LIPNSKPPLGAAAFARHVKTRKDDPWWPTAEPIASASGPETIRASSVKKAGPGICGICAVPTTFGIASAAGAGLLIGTIGTAVDAYVTATGTTWVDWEERSAPTPEPPG